MREQPIWSKELKTDLELISLYCRKLEQGKGLEIRILVQSWKNKRDSSQLCTDTRHLCLGKVKINSIHKLNGHEKKKKDFYASIGNTRSFLREIKYLFDHSEWNLLMRNPHYAEFSLSILTKCITMKWLGNWENLGMSTKWKSENKQKKN